MKAAVFVEPGKMEVKEMPKPKIEKPTDAIIRIVRACVCGSDLWWYRGISKRESGSLVGHEAIGIVEEIGKDVVAIHPGDFVIVPFTHGCGRCAPCRAGFDGSCLNPTEGANGGYQGEYLRFEHANWALINIPGKPEDYTDAQLNNFLTLADVMATGYHSAVSAEVKKGDAVAVIGDGAVGLCGIIGARLLGASRIILLSHHEDRAKLGREFGATDIVSERGADAVKKIMELTNGVGVDAVQECVGATSAIEQAGKIARPGAVIGRVGVPQTEPSSNTLFWKNIGLRGGIANVTTYDKNILLRAVLEAEIDPGKVFTKRFDLDHIQDAYEAMDKREAIKSLIIVSDK